MTAYGKRIKRLRKRLGLTQEKLAKRLRVHRVTLAQWERDASIPHLPTWEKIKKLEEKEKLKRVCTVASA